MTLVSSLVAKIETSLDAGPKIGTAYPIAKGYIITAYHVFDSIEDFEKAKVSWPRNDDQKTDNQTGDSVSITEIIYKDKNYDIVIAKCKTPEHTNNVNWCSSQSVTGNWTSIGFAATGKDLQNKVRHKNPAGGQIMQPLDDDWTLHLESTGNASDVTLWRGMSGAPVFIEDTNTLLAIITNTPNKDKNGKPVHNDRLYSVSIPYLLNKCPEFKKAVSFDSDISVFLENAAKVLKDEELTALFTANDETLSENELELSRHLSQLPLRDFLRLVFQLQKDRSNFKAGLGKLVCTLLPHLFDDDKATEIRAGIGDISCPLVAL